MIQEEMGEWKLYRHDPLCISLGTADSDQLFGIFRHYRFLPPPGDCADNAIPFAENRDNCAQSTTSMRQKQYYSIAQGAKHGLMYCFHIKGLLCHCLLLT